jgi:hypothetical protein
VLEEDPTIFFDDFALPVTGRGVSVERGGILDLPQEFVGEDGDVMVTDYMLLVRASDFGAIRMGDVMDVDGIRYRARRDARLMVDGVFAQIGLMRLKGVRYESDVLIDDDDTGQPDTVIEE